MKFASIWDIGFGSFLQLFLNMVVEYKECGQFTKYLGEATLTFQTHKVICKLIKDLFHHENAHLIFNL